MIDFSSFPKQWLVSSCNLGEVIGGKHDLFSGWHIAAAEAVPILRLCRVDGSECGRLIGWVIEGERLHTDDGVLLLALEDSPEELFKRLAGRFVMLWRCSQGQLMFREDASGGLPAIYVPEEGTIGSTVTLIDQIHPLSPNLEIEEIFNFPERKGFLPFGLTPKQGAHRLMPNYALELEGFTVARVWPNAALCSRDELSETAIAMLVTEAAGILRQHMTAILSQGETVLYLSGGYDSRMILAAAQGQASMLRAETMGDPKSLDAHIAIDLANRAGIKHRIVPVKPASTDDVSAWLHRSGRMMCDAVTAMGPTAAETYIGTHSLSGTGADIVKGKTFEISDTTTQAIALERLLAEFDLPDHPIIRCLGQTWMDSFAGCGQIDAIMMLDLARMEQRHGGWAGAAIYGHPVPRPSLQPFNGQRLYEITLEMPVQYRLQQYFYRDLMRALWPELLEIPVNRASGAARLRFWKSEVRTALPSGLKRHLKQFFR